jgi:hypothetical protein
MSRKQRQEAEQDKWREIPFSFGAIDFPRHPELAIHESCRRTHGPTECQYPECIHGAFRIALGGHFTSALGVFLESASAVAIFRYTGSGLHCLNGVPYDLGADGRCIIRRAKILCIIHAGDSPMTDGPATAPPALPPQMQVLDIALGYFRSRALTVAAELEVADHLADGPLHVDDLAKRTRTHAPTLFRILRALETVGVFVQSSPRVFANTPLSEAIRKNVPGSMRTMILAGMAPGCGEFEAWTGLLDSVKTGEVAFDRIYGYSFWEFLKRDPAQAELFNDSMASGRSRAAAAVAMAYDWSQFPVIADIGGGIGGQLIEILAAHPACRGILFDLPEGLQGAAPHDRIEVVSGNFFESAPVGADAYILRSIVHDWPDEQAVAILRTVRKAMKPGARVIVIEMVVPETSEPAFSKWLDLHMLVVAGGKERTASEFRKLLREAGFELEQIIPTSWQSQLIIGRPV